MLIVNINVYAISTSDLDKYKSYKYLISKYNIDMIVKEDNSIDITETITIHFNEPSHGIYRTIPIVNEVKKYNGDKTYNIAKVDKISVNTKYKKKYSNGYINLIIGDLKKTVSNDQTYIIKYTYKMGKDQIKDYDELYFNMISKEWRTVIGNITFKITMPKNFDSNKLNFYGYNSSISSKNVNYTVSNNQITGNFDGILNSNESLTVRCKLQEGYFSKSGRIDLSFLDASVISLICLAGAILIWFIFGREDLIIKTVEFSPPFNLNSLEVSFLYHEKAERKDVSSLLIYLASKGYIEIIKPSSKIFRENALGYKIKKLKEYDGNKRYEKMFFDSIFIDRNTNKTLNEVMLNSVHDNLYVATTRILADINSENIAKNVFKKHVYIKLTCIIILIFIIHLFTILLPIIKYKPLAFSTYAESYYYLIVIVIIIFSVIKNSLSNVALNYTISAFNRRIYIIKNIIFYYCVVPILFLLPIFTVNITYLINYIIGMACIFIMLRIASKLQVKNSNTIKILGRIVGFKEFLETVEKDKLDNLVMQNPTYFYDILPYVYVFNISDKWINKFESINTDSPYWFTGADQNWLTDFGNFIFSGLDSLEKQDYFERNIPDNRFTSWTNDDLDFSSKDNFSSTSDRGIPGGGSGGGGGGVW